MRRGYSKKSASPLSVSGVRRCHTSHGSTLLARDAQTPGRTTATRAGRTNGRANARRQVRHSVEQLAAAEGAQRDNWPLVTSCNGKAPARSSRAAREWYRPPLTPQGPSTQWASLCAGHRGLFSVFAYLTRAVYHRGGGMSSGCGYQSSRRGGVGLPPNGVLSPAVRSQPWPDGLGRQVSQVSARA